MKDWFKKHYVGLTAGVIAIIALATGVKNCDDNEETNARVSGIEANVDSLANNQNRIIEVVNEHESRIRENRQNIDNLKARMSAVEDSIDVHREVIDSLGARVDSVEMRVDTIAKRQEKCPCINPKPVRNPARRPSRPNNVPVRHDTVFVVVKQEPVPVQNANGCGDDQNANVVIRGNNNTVTISNNGNSGKACADTTRTVKRRVTASCEATLVVNTVVTRNSYCK